MCIDSGKYFAGFNVEAFSLLVTGEKSTDLFWVNPKFSQRAAFKISAYRIDWKKHTNPLELEKVEINDFKYFRINFVFVDNFVMSYALFLLPLLISQPKSTHDHRGYGENLQ